jgi:cytochrome c oxidase subunit 3
VGDLISYPKRGAHAEGTGLVGMIIFLGSWGMMFAALFFAYGIVRMKAPVWPPVDQPRLPSVLAGFNTLVLLGASVVLHLSILAVRRGNVKVLARMIAAAALMGLLFFSLQLVSWTHVWRSGMTPNTGPYASVFYALTCFHALHVLVGVLALAFLAFRAHKGAFSVPRHQAVRLWALYWHFVGVVWVVMYVTVYLI